MRVRQKPPGIPGHIDGRRGAAGAGAAELGGGWAGGLQQDLVPFALDGGEQTVVGGRV